MVKSKLIVVWDCEDILSSSIKVLLAAKKNWEVVSISNREGVDNLKMAVESIQPDTVIIHQGNLTSPDDLAMHLLQDHHAIKVIALSLENNLMDIYVKHEQFIRQASDLIGAIEDEL